MGPIFVICEELVYALSFLLKDHNQMCALGVVGGLSFMYAEVVSCLLSTADTLVLYNVHENCI